MGIYVKTPTGKKPIGSKITADEISAALGYTPADKDAVPDIDLSNITSDDDTFYIVDENDNIVAKIDREGFHTVEVSATKLNATEVNATDVNLGEKETTEWSLKKHLEDAKLETATEDTVHVTKADRARWNANTAGTDEGITEIENKIDTHIANTAKHWSDADREALDADDEGKTFVIVDKDGYKIAEFDAAGLHVLDLLLGASGKSIETLIDEKIDEIDIPEVPEVDLSNYYKKSETYSRAEVNAKIPSLDEYAKTGDVTQMVEDVESIAKGAQQAVSFGSYQDMILEVDTLSTDAYKVGQNVLIKTLSVPDLWVYAKSTTYAPYTYTSDDAIVTALKTGVIKVGYYEFAALETGKVALTDYVKKTEQTTALANLKQEMSEEIVSDKEEFHIVDDNDNIVATIDKDGVHTTTVTADAVVVNGSDIATALNSIVTGMQRNYVSQNSFSNAMSKLIDGTTPVAKASTSNSLAEGYAEYTAVDGKITLTTPIDKAVLISARGTNVNSALEAMLVFTGYSTPSHSGYYCVRSAAPSSLNVVTFYNSSGATFTPYTVRVREL